MTHGHAGGVGLVRRQWRAVTEQRHDGALHLLLARPAHPHHRLLDAQRRIFEHRQIAQGRGRDGRAARRAENLRGLEVLDVNRLLERHVPHVEVVEKRRHRAVNFRQRRRHGAPRRNAHRAGAQQHRRPPGPELDQHQTRAAEARVDAKHLAGEGGPAQIGCLRPALGRKLPFQLRLPELPDGHSCHRWNHGIHGTPGKEMIISVSLAHG